MANQNDPATLTAGSNVSVRMQAPVTEPLKNKLHCGKPKGRPKFPTGGIDPCLTQCFLTAFLFSPSSPARQAPAKQERDGIVNFTKVDAVVACGGATDTKALDGLKADGFKAVINLRTATENGANLEQNAARAKEIGIKYISIPFAPAQPDPKAVDTFLAEIANKNNQPVYVHCGSASRVGSFWLVKRVLRTVDRGESHGRGEFIGLRGELLEKFARRHRLPKE